jgi:hypothetical protein
MCKFRFRKWEDTCAYLNPIRVHNLKMSIYVAKRNIYITLINPNANKCTVARLLSRAIDL